MKTRIAAGIITVLWLAIMALGGPTFGSISEVTSDDQSTFLPSTAESTQASEFQRDFSDTDSIPAIVVSPAPGPDREAIAATPGVTDVIGPIPSEDGEAVQVIALIEDTNTVEQLREFGNVTGPAGYAFDLGEAFAGIDGLLLAVAVGVVFVILVIVYRSVLLPIIVLATSMAALCASIVLVYWMAKAEWIALNGQAQGILSILVIGATTDYGLLLVARFREELLRTEETLPALKDAVKASFGAITASASTVALALLCLLFSDLNSNQALGPIAAVGIACAWVAALTLLPALLTIGRVAFWPTRPRYGDTENSHKIWHKVADVVKQSPRRVWIITAIFLVAGAAFAPMLNPSGVSTANVLLKDTDSKAGQELIDAHFASGSGSPTTIFVPADQAETALEIIEANDGVESVYATASDGSPARPGNAPAEVDGRVYLQATLRYEAESPEARDAVTALREELSDVDAIVGGTTATLVDSIETGQRDLRIIIPIVLLAVWIILVVLLRSIALPTLLMVATVLSFGTAMGTAALLFKALGFESVDPSVPLYGFVFLVALGIDYTIFLMTRAREETGELGTREGVLTALVSTGGVITSAGVVLAATFAALAVLPLAFMVQLAFIVAFGVLVDTLIVRTLLIPGLVLDIGRRVWWPAKVEA